MLPAGIVLDSDLRTPSTACTSLPDAFRNDQASPMPPEQVHRALGREYGKGWERRFTHFDWEPVAREAAE